MPRAVGGNRGAIIVQVVPGGLKPLVTARETGSGAAPVPMRELLSLHGEFYRQFGGDDPGFLGRIS
jgi:hypothetical protein